jgi:hypothetical protein
MEAILTEHLDSPAMHALPVHDQRRLRSTVGVLPKLQWEIERGGADG